MITTSEPAGWQDLQEEVARILRECGFSVDVERTFDTARGSVELDVYAQETVDGRHYGIVCECKHWRQRVPQAVVHGFRTVIGDLGANLGLIVASNGFQAGATPAAAYSNVRLVTWQEFQMEFECTWLKRFLQETVAKRCDPLLTYSEPLLPTWFGDLEEYKKEEFLNLKRQYDQFGLLMMTFTPYVRMLNDARFPTLPLREQMALRPDSALIPESVLDAVGYREFLNAALAHSDEIIAKFRALRPTQEPQSEYE
jgi:hypothetical protein